MKNIKTNILLLLLITSFSVSAQSYDRNILLEVFTNSHCPVCPGTHSSIDNYLTNGAQKENVRYIYYHMEFPYSDDKLNQANKTDATARNNYYGPYSGTPVSFFDGSKQVNSYSQWPSIIETRVAVKTPVKVTLSGEKEEGTFSVDAKVEMENENITSGSVIHFIVVENVNYNGRNGISNHKHVMRKMITGSNGESITNMTSQIISKTISANSDWQLENLGIIVFIQNTQSKEIYQSEFITYNDLSITDIREISSVPEKFNLSQNYPNPFNPSTQISFQLSENNFTELKVYDILGNETATLISEDLSSGSYEVDFNASEFSSGIYFYVLKSGQNIKTNKMILLK